MTEEQVSDTLPQEITITVRGKEIPLSPLTPGDFAKAESYVKEDRVNGLLQSTRATPLTPQDRGRALADIMTTPVGLSDVLSEYSGQLRLVWLSTRGKAGTFDQFKKYLDVTEVAELARVVAFVTGLTDSVEESDDPLASVDPDTITLAGIQTFRGGNGSSPTSQTGTE